MYAVHTRHDCALIRTASRNSAWPGGDRGHTDPALVKAAFTPAQRSWRAHARIGRVADMVVLRTVVSGKHEGRVFSNPEPGKLGAESSDLSVQFGNRSEVGLHLLPG